MDENGATNRTSRYFLLSNIDDTFSKMLLI